MSIEIEDVLASEGISQRDRRVGEDGRIDRYQRTRPARMTHPGFESHLDIRVEAASLIID